VSRARRILYGVPGPPRVNGPLDDVNDAFHASYDAARREAEGAVPILVVAGDELVRFRGDERCAFPIGPKRYHAIKCVAHAPPAVYALLERPLGEVAPRLTSLRDALASVSDDDRDAACVIEGTIAFIDDALAGKKPSLDAFARTMGPLLLKLTETATRLQLDALHESTVRALSDLSAAERDALRVVVTGEHQARSRSLAMQYFRRRLMEPAGAEHRVLYGEAITNEDEARALVGKNRLDRRIAHAFFGEAARLQRDILGDAAAAEIERFEPLSSKLAP
jgi:hypothetical protein